MIPYARALGELTDWEKFALTNGPQRWTLVPQLMRTISVSNGLILKLKLRCCRADLAAFSYEGSKACPCCKKKPPIETPHHHIMCPAWSEDRSRLIEQLSHLSTSIDSPALSNVMSLVSKRDTLLPTIVLSACTHSLASALVATHSNFTLRELSLSPQHFLLLQPIVARFLSTIHARRARLLLLIPPEADLPHSDQAPRQPSGQAATNS